MRHATTPLGKALEERLGAREATAEYHVTGAMKDAGLSDEEVTRVLKRVGQKLAWALWEVAIEETDKLAAAPGTTPRGR